MKADPLIYIDNWWPLNFQTSSPCIDVTHFYFVSIGLKYNPLDVSYPMKVDKLIFCCGTGTKYMLLIFYAFLFIAVQVPERVRQ